MRPDVADFYSGTSFGCHRFLGAHPAGEGWQFTVWAPHARRVQVLGDWNGWQHAAELAFCEDGLWRGKVHEARQGQCYKYNIQCADGGWRLRADPFAFGFELPPATASRLTRPCPAAPVRCPVREGRPAAIYELHAASWRRHWDGRYYSGQELADALIPWLLAHRFTHVELLPLAEHPFDGSWGYHGVGFFAPTARLGGAAGFRALVDALHAAGIGVLMDFVPLHFAPDDGFLSNFDGTPLFECGPSEWGGLNFNWNSAPVRSFLQSAAAFWLEAGCDGLRVDATGSALRHLPGADPFLRGLTAGLRQRFPDAVLAAEETDFAGERLGFTYVWDTGWAFDAVVLLSAAPEERPGLARRMCGCMDIFFREKPLNALSHDWAGLVGRLWGNPAEKLAQARLLALMQYTRPGKKLVFMGSEAGVWHGFDAGKEPDWAILRDADYAALNGFYRALGALYADHPALYVQEYDERCFAWALRGDTAFGWLRAAGGEVLLCLFNALPSPVRVRPDLHGFSRAEPVFTTGFAAGPFRDAVALPGFGGGVWRLEK